MAMAKFLDPMLIALNPLLSAVSLAFSAVSSSSVIRRRRRRWSWTDIVEAQDVKLRGSVKVFLENCKFAVRSASSTKSYS